MKVFRLLPFFAIVLLLTQKTLSEIKESSVILGIGYVYGVSDKPISDCLFAITADDIKVEVIQKKIKNEISYYRNDSHHQKFAVSDKELSKLVSLFRSVKDSPKDQQVALYLIDENSIKVKMVSLERAVKIGNEIERILAKKKSGEFGRVFTNRILAMLKYYQKNPSRSRSHPSSR
jgi:hypothetical protein